VTSATKHDKLLDECRKELDQLRAESSRVKVENCHLTSALRDAESTKQAKDRYLKQLQQ
jgi:hypothetical protein